MNAIVKAGQIWRDNDPRTKGRRRILIETVWDGHAYGLSANKKGQFHRQTRIALKRFTPTSTGYVLDTDV